MATIIAKYAGECKVCGGAIHVGEKIVWGKESGARHPQCIPGTRSSEAKRSRGEARTTADATCANCSAPLNGRGRNRRDSNGMPGTVCRDCSYDSSSDLSFS